MKPIMEYDGTLSENWYIAALSKELTSTKPLARKVYGKSYALYRDSTGKALAIEDRCLHRGTKLSEGRCTKQGITCPYHGWTYDSQGYVIDIPSEGPSSPELSTTIRQRKWQNKAPEVTEQDGVIWLWLGLQPPKEKPSWRFPHCKDPQWTSYFMVTDFANEVDHLVQNFMDVPHTVFVHSKWFRDQNQLQVPYQLQVRNGCVKATYLQPTDSIGNIMGRIINPKNAATVHTDEFIYPNITRVDYSYGDYGFVINSQCTPVDRFESRVYTWIAYRGIRLAKLLKPLIQYYTRQVIIQDVGIMANQGSNLRLHSNVPSDFKSTAADEIHLAISKLRDTGRREPEAAFKIQFDREREFWI